MIVDILSDLLLDFYFKQHLTTNENILSLFGNIFTDNSTREIGNILIIAGDIGHNNEQKFRDLKNLSKRVL